MKIPAIDVITVCRNAAETLPATLASVRSQRGVDFQHLILDGASTDSTRAVIETRLHERLRFWSEPDQGMYDAINKGLARSSAEVVAILNADDMLSGPNVLQRVCQQFAEDPSLDALYGDIVHFTLDQARIRVTRRWVSGVHTERKWRLGWHPPHPALFLRRRAYELAGPFDLRLKTAADYEFMLRLLYVRHARWKYLPETLTLQRAGGQSNKDLRAVARANLECRRAWILQGLTPPWLLIPGKLGWKASQRVWRREYFPAPFDSPLGGAL